MGFEGSTLLPDEIETGRALDALNQIGSPMRTTDQIPFEALKLRGRQRIPLSAASRSKNFFVGDGVILVETVLNGGRQQLLSILFPGDAMTLSFIPPMTKVDLVCASKSGLILQKHVAQDGKSGSEGAGWERPASDIGYQAARQSLQAVIASNLSGDERVATLLIEFARRLGRPYAGGFIFEMPLTRLDIANYLGLNPDTVSRIVSSFKADGVIRTFGRSSIACSDMSALSARSPIADILSQMIARRMSA